MKAEIHGLCAQIVSALLNGAYQGILVTALITVALRLLVRTNASTRHAIWFFSLLLIVLIFPAHYWLDRNLDQPGRAVANHNFLTSIVANSRTPVPDFRQTISDPFDLGSMPNDATKQSSLTDAVVPDSLPIDLTTNPTPETQQARPDFNETAGKKTEAVRAINAGRRGHLPSIAEARLRRFLQPISFSIESEPALAILIAVLCGWGAMAAIRLGLVVLRVRNLRNFANGSSLPQPDLQALFDQLKDDGGVTRSVDLRVSFKHQSPVVLGFVHPIILLPGETASKTDLSEAREILRHELAHVRRYDDWANLVQHAVRAIFFFHPAVWWIGERLSLEMEIACDDYVLHQGGGRRNYALILTSVASRIHQRTPLLAPGVSNSNSQLQQRISMILNTRRNSSPRLAKTPLVSILTATGLVAALALYAGPRLVLAAAPVAGAAIESPGVVPSPAVAVAGEPVPEAPVVVVAGPEPPAPGVVAVGVDPGPKFKPENPGEPPSAQVEPPEAPDLPLMPDPPPRVARAGRQGKAPRSPDGPDAADGKDGSLEERVRRLEKMVHSLMDQQGARHSRGMIYFKDGSAEVGDLDQEKLEKLKQSVDRQSARAAEQAQRAAEQAKRATKEMEARVEQDQLSKGEAREGFQKQLEALRKARESLGQEMERLDRQIEKIEKEQQRGDKEPQRRRSEATGLRLQASVDVSDDTTVSTNVK
jgi:beta-lactamase regulating signal transducer with metallopeptidase domain